MKIDFSHDFSETQRSIEKLLREDNVFVDHRANHIIPKDSYLSMIVELNRYEGLALIFERSDYANGGEGKGYTAAYYSPGSLLKKEAIIFGELNWEIINTHTIEDAIDKLEATMDLLSERPEWEPHLPQKSFAPRRQRYNQSYS